MGYIGYTWYIGYSTWLTSVRFTFVHVFLGFWAELHHFHDNIPRNSFVKTSLFTYLVGTFNPSEKY
jgi:hypothetical protein